MKFWGFREKGIENFESSVPNRGVKHVFFFDPDVAFKSWEDHRKQLELEKARKSGLAPTEVDEDGKEINFHIPLYVIFENRYALNF
ncbi:pre-mRNA-splicing factor SLU7-A-like [Humulus lupulus]|uniref:pre-mRNA-splicing factor SLU7-A-like n=1 Tax=Humulus lupulus TaxID=3486 RepID=UPI002B410918|nr:pre-mRNA-splicing factor SLU7-A-like [Humulus lupulus]